MRFDLLKPDYGRLVTSLQAVQKAPSNKLVMPPSLSISSEVMVRDCHHTDKWVPGRIVWKLGPVTCQADTGNGNIIKCHVDQLTQCLVLQSVGFIIESPA